MPKRNSIRGLAIFVTAVLWSAGASVYGQSRPANFGQQWVRSHPLTLMGLQQWPVTFDVAEHRAANMTYVLAWWADGNGKQIAALASAGNLPWHALIVDGEGDERDRIADYASVGNGVGWMLGDEVNRQQMSFFGDLAAWTQANRPNDLVYSNAFPTYATSAQLYGGVAPPGGYAYHQYLEDIVATVNPDLLMYDHYPFFSNGTERSDYYINLMAVREVALEHGLPYWGFMQASQHFNYRLPSRSDARFQMFSHLSGGYTGMGYFTFDSFGTTSILDPNGNPSALYPIVTDLNKEAANLGWALRFMTSDNVKYVAGRHIAGGPIISNVTPAGMETWTAANDSDDHILNITINNIGLGLDGLFGCFTDDRGQSAFMLVSAYHGAGVPATSEQSFSILFDNSVNELFRMDRITGQQELVTLVNHQLDLTIPAGTGELFKYSDGNFLVAAPVPGDYNGNGTVDAADYVLWRKGGPLLNEVKSPGTVNPVDYSEWRARFGNPSSGSGAGATASSEPPSSVPEPAALAMFIVTAAGIPIRRHCRTWRVSILNNA